MGSDSILTWSSSEQRRVNQINKAFQREVSSNIDEDDANDYACLFQVPKNMSRLKPEAYTPQLIALGPRHHFRPELYKMERYKLVAAKQVLNQDQAVNFKHLVVDELIEFGPTIRGCYNKFFDLGDETLGWIGAIDGLSLIHFLESYRNGQIVGGDGMVRDIMVVENRVPMVLLKKIWKILELSSNDVEDDDSELGSILIHFCEAQSPLKLAQESTSSLVSKSAHLLDVMYKLIVKNGMAPTEGRLVFEGTIGTVGEILDNTVDLNIPGAPQVHKPVKLVHKLPWHKIDSLVVQQEGQTPLIVEEIEIPSATDLCHFSNIQFVPTSGGIRDFEFHKEDLSFYLPSITLNCNSEVILKNLVAYEALSAKLGQNGTLELSQYVDLITEDSRRLKEASIIKGNLSNEEIADLFNGMSKSDGEVENEKSKLEKTLDRVNESFEKKPRVKCSNP